MGTPLRSAQQASSAGDLDSVEPGQGKMQIEFLDASGGTGGRHCRVSGAFGLMPMTGAFLPIGQAKISAVSIAGIPKLDIVICFDVSGSMDDATPVTFVKRSWDPNGRDRTQALAPVGSVKYEIARAGSGLAQGKIIDVLQPPPVGTSVNALPPQNLDAAEESDQAQIPLRFGAALRKGEHDFPGDKPTTPGSPPPTLPASDFTDLVVNINGLDSFDPDSPISFPFQELPFPNLAALIEAARGNLNDQARFHSSGADTALFGLVSPNPNYQAVYQRAAKRQLQPLSASLQALTSFLDTMKADTDAHFGFVAFSDPSPEETPLRNIAFNYVPGGHYPPPPVPQSWAFPVCPIISLSQSADNYDDIYNQLQDEDRIPKLTAAGLTDIGGAISKALDQLKSNSRPGAKKAIVLFTDGEPADISGNQAEAEQEAIGAARNARNAGIPVYTVALPQPRDPNAFGLSDQTRILNEIAKVSGGELYWASESSKLRGAFQRIAIRLVALIR